MASDDKIADQFNLDPPSSSSPSNLSSSASDPWKQRILIPTLLAGISGAAVGSISKHRKVLGLSAISKTYATNFAIVTGCYCGAREFVRVSREGKPDDLLNSAIAGFGSGAILGRLQAGPVGAARYSVMFAVVGTAVDYATSKIIMPAVDELKEKKVDWFQLPEWSPIRVLDEEALAAKREEAEWSPTHSPIRVLDEEALAAKREEALAVKRAREEQIYRSVHNLNKEES